MVGRACSRPGVQRPVVFQKWRWTENTVTLGLIFIVSLRKEWPMTFIAVRCPHCQSDQIVKRGKTARGHCQVVEVDTRIRQAGASPQSYSPFRRPAPYP